MPDEINQTPNLTGQPQEPASFVQQPVKTAAVRVNTTALPKNVTAMPGKKSFYQQNKWYIWATAIGLVIIVVLAFLAFRKQPVAAPKAANVSIGFTNTPDSVPSGGDMIYHINLENNDPSTLTNVQLELVYPDGFTYEDSNPVKAQNLSGTLFAIPNLTQGVQVPVIVKVKAGGNVGDSKQLTARLHYSYSNFSSEFVQENTSTVKLIASNVDLTIDGPTTTNNAQLVVYTLKYQNNSNGDLNQARVQVQYPDGFSFAQSDPQPSLGNNIWNIGTLAKGGSGTITVQGTFQSANPGESKTFNVALSVLGPTGNYDIQNSSSFITAISSLPLMVTQTVTPGGDNNIINPGDTLQYSIHYQNNATVAANAVVVQVTLGSKALDLSSIQAEGAQVNNNVITWNASSASQLASLSPNQSGDLHFQVRVNDPATKDSSKNLSVVSHVQIQSNEYSTPLPGGDITLKISSPSSLTGNLAFSSGSLPPKVGQSTTYTVTLTLKNSTNDFSNTAVTAFIPLGAGGFITGSANPASQVNFDPSTGKLTWNAGSLPAHTGQFTQPKTLTFQVKLNPSANQANTSPTLVKNIQYQATDLYTNQNISGGVDDITTSSLSDNSGYSNGQVQP